ncbi:MAG: HEAT repeat domain-containing protein, partial [Cyanobacteriota bacterium]|nr:HEAT repeat domain-containing protein [Cyanobacteriota bacterium]
GLPKGQERAYLARLVSLYRGEGEARLRAIEAIDQWGDRRALPLLRRALRDSDPLVMRAAALAIERFRGRTTAAAPLAAQPPAAPRRVSRTR